jgi:cellulose synthase/poly-beta-1,6-N-acetylglucosamine synthase-like glycosyltransferase
MLVLWVGISVYLLINSRRVAFLKNQTPLQANEQPAVAVIIAVKDEEAEVEEALRSVCRLQYTNYRIVVINDRSVDKTPFILQEIAAHDPRISLITIEELPQGWLGKNHALYKGYQSSSEEWMLFTDADVLFAPQALDKAMQYTLQNRLDHLTVLPEVTSRSSLFKSVMNTFALMLEVKLRPWDVSKPLSKASMGVGAFNLVKRTAYEKAGTHMAFSLRPDDDLKLGERVKAAGGRQAVMYGNGEIWLEWYTSLPQFVQGLMKNTFSVSNYNLPTALAMALSTFLIIVLPVPLLLFSGWPGNLAGLIIILAQATVLFYKRGLTAKWWHALVIPFAGLVMTYIIVKSALLTIRQGGIYWRDSFYPLAELRKQV